MKKINILMLLVLPFTIVADTLESASAAYVAKDFEKAAKLFEQDCDSSIAKACAMLGVMYSHGSGVSQSYTKAKEYYKKACDANFALACDGYIELSKQGH